MPNESLPPSLSLFPLPTVLVPGAALGLRVFEPRYLDLVSECGRRGTGFGVCLLMNGDGDPDEGAETTAAAAFGTEAVIEDFGTGDDGLLTLRVRGRRRFHARQLRVRDNGLQVAEVEWCDDDPVEPLRPEHGLLATLLQGVLEQVGGEHADALDTRIDDAAWVGWRLVEMLPLDDLQRQQLLQLDDPHERLDRLLHLLPED
ncbi:ATP-dependent protease [Lysobacter arseniciresistens ZS79]|uniref:ATP-dependent protease n=1 Tax=Lysobacter arseniciresistens ZS79 TaxID=913325 RepID=A0A0A0EW65_9GAMM|nr:LON peptidase substrate-binding domain-containing protein [Lysobacter arseniciresistens]KGM54475.1 ATP-dependent protease [Lysobacter arseniciresistens ZS79]